MNFILTKADIIAGKTKVKNTIQSNALNLRKVRKLITIKLNKQTIVGKLSHPLNAITLVNGRANPYIMASMFIFVLHEQLGTSKNPLSCQILVKYWHLEFNQRPGDEATQCNQK
jgi:hypothetical protein